MSSYWVWCGPIVDFDQMLSRRAVSPAANRWQRALVEALDGIGQPVVVLNSVPEPAFPRGPLVSRGGGNWSLKNGEVIGIDYLNVPGFRRYSQALAVGCALIKLLARRGRPRALITYNAAAAYRLVGSFAQHRLHVRWIPVIADVPERPNDRRCHDALVARASGRVYLSFGSFSKAASTAKLHLDGGVGHLRRPTGTPQLRAVMYSGALNRYGGVEFLLRAFEQIPNHELELWICGKGDDRLARAAAQVDPRIRFFGAVNEKELERLSQLASVFVNPRPVSIEANQHNFPSKVLEYLTYLKPVVSTWTDGLAPEYRDVLQVVPDHSPTSLARELREVLAWTDEQRDAQRERAETFLAGKRWEDQAKRFVSWLAQVPGDR